MIRCILILNDHGKARLVRFYDSTVWSHILSLLTSQCFQKQQLILQTVHQLVSNRDDSAHCCFIDNLPPEIVESPEERLIYRHFASLFFIVIADSCESELGVLDLLQVFVHVLDSCFENICELDIVYHYDRVNYVLDEIIMGGMVLETNSEVILQTIQEVNRFSKSLTRV
jgi:AP-3 complex subunit sigma